MQPNSRYKPFLKRSHKNLELCNRTKFRLSRIFVHLVHLRNLTLPPTITLCFRSFFKSRQKKAIKKICKYLRHYKGPLFNQLYFPFLQNMNQFLIKAQINFFKSAYCNCDKTIKFLSHAKNLKIFKSCNSPDELGYNQYCCHKMKKIISYQTRLHTFTSKLIKNQYVQERELIKFNHRISQVKSKFPFHQYQQTGDYMPLKNTIRLKQLNCNLNSIEQTINFQQLLIGNLFIMPLRSLNIHFKPENKAHESLNKLSRTLQVVLKNQNLISEFGFKFSSKIILTSDMLSEWQKACMEFQFLPQLAKFEIDAPNFDLIEMAVKHLSLRKEKNKSLRYFSIDNGGIKECNHSAYKYFVDILDNAKEIQTLKLKIFYLNLDGSGSDFFKFLPLGIKNKSMINIFNSFNLSNCLELHIAHRLKISNTTELNAFIDGIQSAKSIKVLSLQLENGMNKHTFANSLSKMIQSLTYLRELTLSCFEMNVKDFSMVLSNCLQIKVLTVVLYPYKYFNLIQEVFIPVLQKYPMLQYLTVAIPEQYLKELRIRTVSSLVRSLGFGVLEAKTSIFSLSEDGKR